MAFHRDCPDQNGWYWIKTEDENWSMAYLEAEADQQRLVVVEADSGNEDAVVWKRDNGGLWWPRVDSPQRWLGHAWEGPTQWLGPLGYPGGERTISRKV